MMRFLSALLLSLSLSACIAPIPTIPTNYVGPDAGKVVVGISETLSTHYSSYHFSVRRIDQKNLPDEQQIKGYISFYPHELSFLSKYDYENENEHGDIVVSTLPAGDYEIFNCGMDLYSSNYEKHFFSRENFSIPFSVKTGQTTYLGNYQANGIYGLNIFMLPIPAGAQFVVASRPAEDLKIAIKKDDAVVLDGTDATPIVKNIGSPFFVEKFIPQKTQGLQGAPIIGTDDKEHDCGIIKKLMSQC